MGYRLTGAALAALAAAGLGTARPAHATPACEVLMCMSGISGNGSALPSCQPAIDYYFSIVRYDAEGFDAAWTAAARLAFLQSCEGAAVNEHWVSVIQADWGTVP